MCCRTCVYTFDMIMSYPSYPSYTGLAHVFAEFDFERKILYDVSMHDTPSSNHNHVPALSPRRKVWVVWALLAVVFVLFNALYWPMRSCQELSHPASFVAYAQYLLDRNAAQEAHDVLTEGIERINPPTPRPYELLARTKQALSDREGAEFAHHRAVFYEALQQSPPPFDAVLGPVEAMGNRYAAVHLNAQARSLLRRAAASFGAAFEMREPMSSLSTSAQLALFEMTGSAVSFSGYIGDTGVAAPTPLLVYSGGGMDARRNAHILVGARDYADRQRGMHVVLLDGVTAAVLQTGVFDLWENAEEARRMRHFLEDAPAGCIGLFAVRDDGSAFLTSPLEQALFGFGLDRLALDGREPAMLGLRYSFAAIGVKGAAHGTAMQSWSPEKFKGYRGHPVLCAVFHEEETS